MDDSGNGKCIIVSAPSGAGKTTIVRRLLDASLQLEFSVSATSRRMRPGEVDGLDYFFLSPVVFREYIDQGRFLEWEEVYPDHYYGTLKSEVERIWGTHRHVIFDVDVYGGIRLKEYFGKAALSVFIMPPSPEALRVRLMNRGTESAQSLAERIGKAEHEIGFAGRFDLVVVNDNLEAAVQSITDSVIKFVSS
jgi:guanylate kinase